MANYRIRTTGLKKKRKLKAIFIAISSLSFTQGISSRDHRHSQKALSVHTKLKNQNQNDQEYNGKHSIFESLTKTKRTTHRKQKFLHDSKTRTGLYPRGGEATPKYRDVLQLSQRSTLKERLLDKKEQLSNHERPLKPSPDHRRMTFDEKMSPYIQNAYQTQSSVALDVQADESSSCIGRNDNIERINDTEDLDKLLFSRNIFAAEKVEKTNMDNPVTKQKGNPVIYRYFPRSRARSRSSSIPFIVLCPSVDHWKIVGKILAGRGFNVMACQQVKDAKKETDQMTTSRNNNSSNGVNDGEALISAVLDVLKWQRAVIVGCDQEAVMAMEAALRLSPEKVVGLVLCGDLSSFEEHIEKQVRSMQNSSAIGDNDENMDVDSFLRDYVECPTCIIWDGDTSTWSSTRGGHMASSSISRDVDGVRNVIVGGGLAPHRRLPEQFAWSLSRFVEKNVSTTLPVNGKFVPDSVSHPVTDVSTDTPKKNQNNVWKHILPSGINKVISQLFDPGTLLVSGRVIASTIIYLSIARVTIFQYQNIRDIQSSYLTISKWEDVFCQMFHASKVFTFSLPKIIFRHRQRRNRKVTAEDKEATISIDEETESESSSTEDDRGNDNDFSHKEQNEETEHEERDNKVFENLVFFDHIIS